MGTNNDLVVANKPFQESRYLGVYIKSQAGSSHIIKRVKNEIKSMVNLLKYKKVTALQVVYINNVVLMARLEYWTAQYADFIVRINSQEWDGGQSQSILRPNQIKITLGISAARPIPYFAKITVDFTPSPRYQPIIPQHSSFDR
ncbi:hypothetical protein C1646_769029 [Rhizophagus diaphanus]|nr:hypothetical protein C1646_769029 [Rhizophagus diaphanus] [Rhizophagus sp. MUCL 43196]